MASQSTLLGAAGEHFIMSELLRRGFIAALAPAGVPNADIIVTDIQGGRLCSIQVKTRRDIGADGGWHMKSKHEDIRADRLFYCFVDFGKDLSQRAKVFVIPSTTVADVLRESHHVWLNTPGKGGKARQDTVLRRMLPSYAHIFGMEDARYGPGWLTQYQDRWDLLRLEPQAVAATVD